MSDQATVHEVTRAQAKALGMSDAQADPDPVTGEVDWTGAYRNHFLARDQAPEFSEDGDLIVPADAEGKGARIITRDGLDIGIEPPGQDEPPEATEPTGSPEAPEEEPTPQDPDEAPDGEELAKAREKAEAKAKSHYEKLLERVRDFAETTKTPGWALCYAHIKAVVATATHEHAQPGPESKKNHDYNVARINMPLEMFEPITTAIQNLNDLSNKGDLPLWGETLATAIFDEEEGRVYITEGAPLSDEVADMVDEGQDSDEGTTGEGEE